MTLLTGLDHVLIEAPAGCDTELGFTPYLWGKRPKVLCCAAWQVRAAQPRMFFSSPR